MKADPTIYDHWFGVIMSVFLVGAAVGGVLFGWLGDKLGRVRAMTLSIFTYAIFTGLCGFATEAHHLAALRFIASLGMGGEWALGVALIIEGWPESSRAFLAGLMGAASNVGFMLVALISLGMVRFLHGAESLLLGLGASPEVVSRLLAGDGWRLMMMLGAAPSLLVFLVLWLVPESHKWMAQKQEGGASHWAALDLLGVFAGAIGAMGVIAIWSPWFEQLVGVSNEAGRGANLTPGMHALRIALTLVGLFAALAGFLFPVRQYLRRAQDAGQLLPGERGVFMRRMMFGAALSAVALLGTWGSLQWAPKWAIALSNLLPEEGGPYYAKDYTQIASGAGAIIGTIIAALVAGWLGRRITYAGLCIASFITLTYLYLGNEVYGPKLLVSVFVAAGVTAAFYGLFPLYFPELFPTRIRATAQGFAYNFGRVLAAIGGLQTATLTAYFSQGVAPDRIETEAFPTAGATLAGIYLIGLVIIWLGPETKGQPLPD
jgi:MFS family permease